MKLRWKHSNQDGEHRMEHKKPSFYTKNTRGKRAK